MEQSAVAGILSGVQITVRFARGQPELILLPTPARLGILCAVLALGLRRGEVAAAGPMDALLEELAGGVPDWTQFERVIIRLLAAMLLGGIIGVQREKTGKPAGLRTHMLTAMGSTLFVLGGAAAGMSMSDLSRVIQGLAAGIGFIGVGAILKLREQREIEGLTTAAGIWMTAAVGVAVGLGRIGLAFLSVILTWIVLSALSRIERAIELKKPR